MTKITGSRFNMYDENNIKAVTYRECVNDVLDSEEVTKLGAFKHHHFTTRLQHSLNVSYYSYCICRFFGWDYRSAARAGLMHDLYFFKNTSVDENGHRLLKNHPFDALRNSEETFDLNDIEKDAIVNHMWPCTSVCRPKYKESMAVSLSDKFCAVMEAATGSCRFFAGKSAKAYGITVAAAAMLFMKTGGAAAATLKHASDMLKIALNFIA